MDFMTLGTLRSYTKTNALETQWNLKKRSGNVNAHTPTLGDMFQKTRAASAAQAQLDEQRESRDDKLQEIMRKLYAGQSLTREEKEYLKEKNPQLSAQMDAVEQDRKSYEAELKRCQTKEDVQRLKTARLGATLTRIQAVEHNASIPQEKKLEILSAEKCRVEKFNEAERAFVKKGDYAKLPTDAEKTRAEREEREAEEARRGIRTAEENRTEESKRDGNRTEHPERHGNQPDGAERVKEKKEAPETESEIVRKVRRAKRRAGFAAYAASMESMENAPETPSLSRDA